MSPIWIHWTACWRSFEHSGRIHLPHRWKMFIKTTESFIVDKNDQISSLYTHSENIPDFPFNSRNRRIISRLVWRVFSSESDEVFSECFAVATDLEGGFEVGTSSDGVFFVCEATNGDRRATDFRGGIVALGGVASCFFWTGFLTLVLNRGLITRLLGVGGEENESSLKMIDSSSRLPPTEEWIESSKIVSWDNTEISAGVTACRKEWITSSSSFERNEGDETLIL